MNKTKLTYAWWSRFAPAKVGVAANSKDAVWKALLSREFFLPADCKPEPETFIPIIPCKKKLEDILSVKYAEEFTTVRENFNATKLWGAVEGDPSRAANAMLMQDVYQDIIKKLDKGKKGNKSKQQVEALLMWRGFSNKLAKHEDCARDLLHLLECNHSASQQTHAETPARRRRCKMPAGTGAASAASSSSQRAGDDGNPFGAEDVFVSVDVQYAYKTDSLRSRRYANKCSAQNLGTAWQAVALEQTLDLDIENCLFNLMLQLLDRLEPEHPAWSGVRETLESCAKSHGHYPAKAQTKRERRQAIVAEGFPRRRAAAASRERRVHCAATESVSVLSMGSCLVLERSGLGVSVAPEGETRSINSSIFLEHCRGYSLGSLASKGEHLSLHFDGLRIDRNVVQPDVTSFCQQCSSWIEAETGFSVSIRSKEHRSFKRLLDQLPGAEELHCPEKLLEKGNCILAALHHLGYQRQAMAMATQTEGPARVFFARRARRTYEQVEACLEITMFPRVPSAELHAGQKFLLHLATDGCPHCVTVETISDDALQVTNGTAVYTVSADDYKRMLLEATDRKYMLAFYLMDKPAEMPNDAEEGRLIIVGCSKLRLAQRTMTSTTSSCVMSNSPCLLRTILSRTTIKKMRASRTWPIVSWILCKTK